jgi:hypothetical protein
VLTQPTGGSVTTVLIQPLVISGRYTHGKPLDETSEKTAKDHRAHINARQQLRSSDCPLDTAFPGRYGGSPAHFWDGCREASLCLLRRQVFGLESFAALVRDKRPTGYIHQIRNLVPSCNVCNQSKQHRPWRDWMLGDAPGSPRTRGVADLMDRIARLECFEQWGKVAPLPIRDWVDGEQWEAYWRILQSLEQRLNEAQGCAANVNKALIEKYRVSRGEPPQRAIRCLFPSPCRA